MSLNPFEKVEKIRDFLDSLKLEKGNEFDFKLEAFKKVNENSGVAEIEISKETVKRIIRYLAHTSYLDLLKESPENFKIKINGTIKRIRPKTLELISQELKNYYSGTEIIGLLKDAHVFPWFIIYPESKWLMFYRVFVELSLSRSSTDQRILSNIIGSSIHPLNLGGKSDLSKVLLDKFNEWLDYDNYIIVENSKKGYSLYEKPPDNEYSQEKIDEMIEDHERRIKEQREEEISTLQKPQCVESISILHKSYRAVMSLVETFIGDYTNPTVEMNDYYQKLKAIILKQIDDLALNDPGGPIEINSLSYYTDKNYHLPFTSLFSAENEFKEKKLVLNWDSIRPEMNMMFGQIDNLYQLVNANDVLSEPNEQKALNDVSLFLSEIKKKRLSYMAKKMELHRSLRRNSGPVKVEIVKATVIKTESQDKNFVIKNNKKRITLPKFPRTEWSKVSIRFISDRDILISNGIETKPSSFEGFGCEDEKTKKPNINWNFLLKLATNNGRTDPVNKDVREKQKKQKQKITNILRKIFDNDTDPFETEKGGVYIAKFSINYFNEESERKPIKKEYLDLDEMRSEMTTSTQDNIESEFSQQD